MGRRRSVHRSGVCTVTQKFASVVDLLADVRKQARKALQERLLAHAHPDVRNQLLAAVTTHVRGLNDQQIIAWHAMLDTLEPNP